MTELDAAVTERILAYLFRAELREPLADLKDNYRDAWNVVLRASRGETGDLYRLVFQVHYGASPEKLSQRQAEWERWFFRVPASRGSAHVSRLRISVPKKPPASVRPSSTPGKPRQVLGT